MLSKRISTMLLSGAAAAALTTSAAKAIFVFDVRAVSATGGATFVNNKSVKLSVGQAATVTFQLWGLIQEPYDSGLPEDGNPNNEATRSMLGSFLTNGGGVKGNLSATVVAQLQAQGWSVGTMVDLDGDGDLDIGGTSSTASADYWSARTTDTTNGFVGAANVLGTMTLTVAAGGVTDTGNTLLNFRRKVGAANSIGSWTENGASHAPNPTNPDLNLKSGTDVVLSPVAVPEPTSIGLIGLAGLGMLARRRK